MAYEKTNWQTGDVITAAKLNKMEKGIYDAFVADVDNPQNGDVIKYDSTEGKWVNGAASGGGYTPVIPVFTETGTNAYTCNKTYAEVVAAITAGTCDKAYLTGDGGTTVYPLVVFAEGMVIFSKTVVGSDNVGTEVFAYTSDGIQHGIEVYPADS